MKSATVASQYLAFNSMFHQLENEVSPEHVVCRSAVELGKEEDRDHDDLLHPAKVTKEIPEADDNQIVGVDDKAELVRWYCSLGHLPYPRMRLLMQLGVLPKRILKVNPPKFSGCLYGSLTKRQWSNVPKSKRSKIKIATKAGDIVSVDQMETSTPGFIAHLKGNLTKKRYTCATVFVDHYSRLSYVHLQRSMTSEETVGAKKAFERFCKGLF